MDDNISTPNSLLQQAKIEQFEGVKKRLKVIVDSLPIESMARLTKFADEAERWLSQPTRKRFDNGAMRKDPINRSFSDLVRNGERKKLSYSEAITALRPKGVLPRDDDEAMKRLKNLVSRNPRTYYTYADGDVGSVQRINE